MTTPIGPCQGCGTPYFVPCREGCPELATRRVKAGLAPTTVGAPDLVNHPPHYTSHPSGVECIQVTEHLNFCLGNAMKYLWRADEKGDPIENLEKSIWYIRREIARRRAMK